ncbi:MAG: DUF1934 domain-containing protein [Lachnospiraceae bacterium]|nr:DUF1934 domain-containing protein [Lachnospiraceae bacterium]
MTQEEYKVRILIRNRIREYGAALEASEEMEQILSGRMVEKGKTTYVFYEETNEDGGITASRLAIRHDEVSLKRTGAVSWDMRFAPGVISNGIYRTPQGDFSMDVETKNLMLERENDTVRVGLSYELEIQKAHRQCCELWMRIEKRDR